jgi:hypothetical protein
MSIHGEIIFGGMANLRAMLAACVVGCLTACTTADTPKTTPLPFIDDFSSASTGWKVSTDLAGDTKYDAGQLRVFVKNENLTIWSNAGKLFEDMVYEVDMQTVDGPEDNGFGVLFGYKDNQNFCHFEISSDGYWRAGISSKEKRWVNFADWQPNPAIQPGAAVNRVGITIKGETVTYAVNGQQIDTRTQPECRGGDIAVFALSQIGSPGVLIGFDNVSVKAVP